MGKQYKTAIDVLTEVDEAFTARPDFTINTQKLIQNLTADGSKLPKELVERFMFMGDGPAEAGRIRNTIREEVIRKYSLNSRINPVVKAEPNAKFHKLVWDQVSKNISTFAPKGDSDLVNKKTDLYNHFVDTLTAHPTFNRLSDRPDKVTKALKSIWIELNNFGKEALDSVNTMEYGGPSSTTLAAAYLRTKRIHIYDKGLDDTNMVFGGKVLQTKPTSHEITHLLPEVRELALGIHELRTEGWDRFGKVEVNKEEIRERLANNPFVELLDHAINYDKNQAAEFVSRVSEVTAQTTPRQFRGLFVGKEARKVDKYIRNLMISTLASFGLYGGVQEVEAAEPSAMFTKFIKALDALPTNLEGDLDDLVVKSKIAQDTQVEINNFISDIVSGKDVSKKPNLQQKNTATLQTLLDADEELNFLSPVDVAKLTLANPKEDISEALKVPLAKYTSILDAEKIREVRESDIGVNNILFGNGKFGKHPSDTVIPLWRDASTKWAHEEYNNTFVETVDELKKSGGLKIDEGLTLEDIAKTAETNNDFREYLISNVYSKLREKGWRGIIDDDKNIVDFAEQVDNGIYEVADEFRLTKDGVISTGKAKATYNILDDPAGLDIINGLTTGVFEDKSKITARSMAALAAATGVFFIDPNESEAAFASVPVDAFKKVAPKVRALMTEKSAILKKPKVRPARKSDEVVDGVCSGILWHGGIAYPPPGASFKESGYKVGKHAVPKLGEPGELSLSAIANVSKTFAKNRPLPMIPDKEANDILNTYRNVFGSGVEIPKVEKSNTLSAIASGALEDLLMVHNTGNETLILPETKKLVEETLNKYKSYVDVLDFRKQINPATDKVLANVQLNLGGRPSDYVLPLWWESDGSNDWAIQELVSTYDKSLSKIVNFKDTFSTNNIAVQMGRKTYKGKTLTPSMEQDIQNFLGDVKAKRKWLIEYITSPVDKPEPFLINENGIYSIDVDLRDMRKKLNGVMNKELKSRGWKGVMYATQRFDEYEVRLIETDKAFVKDWVFANSFQQVEKPWEIPLSASYENVVSDNKIELLEKWKNSHSEETGFTGSLGDYYKKFVVPSLAATLLIPSEEAKAENRYQIDPKTSMMIDNETGRIATPDQAKLWQKANYGEAVDIPSAKKRNEFDIFLSMLSKGGPANPLYWLSGQGLKDITDGVSAGLRSMSGDYKDDPWYLYYPKKAAGVVTGTANFGAPFLGMLHAYGLRKDEFGKDPDKDTSFLIAGALASWKDSILERGSFGVDASSAIYAITGESLEDVFGKWGGIGVGMTLELALDPTTWYGGAGIVKHLGTTKAVKEFVGRVKNSKVLKPMLGDEWETKTIEAFLEMSGRQRKAFGQSINSMAHSIRQNQLMLKKLDMEGPYNLALAKTKDGRFLYEYTQDEFIRQMGDPAKGDPLLENIFKSEAGIYRKGQVTKFLDFHFAQRGISDVDLTIKTGESNSTTLTKDGKFIVELRNDNKYPYCVLRHELEHVFDLIGGFYGTNKVTPQTPGHFSALDARTALGQAAHKAVIKATLDSGMPPESVARAITPYMSENWAREAMGLPGNKYQPGLRMLKDEPHRAMSEILDRVGRTAIEKQTRNTEAISIHADEFLARATESQVQDVFYRAANRKGVNTVEMAAMAKNIISRFQALGKTWNYNLGAFTDEAQANKLYNDIIAFQTAASEAGSLLQIQKWVMDLRRNAQTAVRLGFDDPAKLISKLDLSGNLGDDIRDMFQSIPLAKVKKNPALGDYLMEYYVSNILMSPSINMQNMITNLVWGGYFNIFRTGVAGTVDAALSMFSANRPRSIYARESIKTLTSLPTKFVAGWRNAQKVLKGGTDATMEINALRYEVSLHNSAFEHSPNRLMRAIAPVANMGLRLAIAADTFVRSAFMGSLHESLALRYSKMGKGTFDDLMQNPPEWLMNEVKRRGDFTVFLDEAGPVMEKFLRLRDAFPLGKFIIPFVYTTSRILLRGMEITPALGLGISASRYARQRKVVLNLANQLHRVEEDYQKVQRGLKLATQTKEKSIENLLKKKQTYLEDKQIQLLDKTISAYSIFKPAIPEMIADQLMGLALVFGAGVAYSKGMITGGYPTDEHAAQRFHMEGKRPWSIKNPLTGAWHSYPEIAGPFAFPVAMAIEVLQTIEEYKNTEGTFVEISDQVANALTNIGEYVKNNTFARSATSAIEFMFPGKGQDRDAMRFAASKLAPFAPLYGITKSVIKAQDAYKTGSWIMSEKGKFEDMPESFLGEFMMAYTGNSLGFLSPKYDYRGRPVQVKLGEPGSMEAWFYGMFQYIRGTYDQTDNVDKMFLKVGYFPSLTSRTVMYSKSNYGAKSKGIKVKLNNELYEQLLLATGKEIDKESRRVLKSYMWRKYGDSKDEKGQERAREYLMDRTSKARARARKRFLAQADVRKFIQQQATPVEQIRSN